MAFTDGTFRYAIKPHGDASCSVWTSTRRWLLPSRPSHYAQYRIHKNGLARPPAWPRAYKHNSRPSARIAGASHCGPITTRPSSSTCKTDASSPKSPGPAARSRNRRVSQRRRIPPRRPARSPSIGGGVPLLCTRVDGQRQTMRTKKPLGYVTSAVFHPDGHTLLAVDRNGCFAWPQRRHGTSDRVACLGRGNAGCAWRAAAIGTLAAAGRRGGKVVLWDLVD